MSQIFASKLNLSFGDNTILDNVTFEINEGEKVGLIGVNGAGKTSLFKLITREYLETSGNIFINKDTVVAHMQQHACHNSENTMYEEILTIFSHVIRIEKELESLENEIHAHANNIDALIERQQHLHDEFVRLGGLTYKSLASSTLIGLGFKQTDFNMPCSVLSGGQKSKISLGKLLLSGANLLLLDEPTNHLDIESVQWFENWLNEYKGNAIIISHDRYFLNKVTNKTLELDRGKIYSAKGNYDTYCVIKKEREKQEQREYDNKVKEISRIEGIIEQQKRFNQARNYITIASKQKSIDRLNEGLEKVQYELDGIRFAFTTKAQTGNDVLSCNNISKSFGDKHIFSGVNLDIKKSERVFIVGENGCGKTTLLKILMGKIPADCGKKLFGSNVNVGYFDQTLAGLDETKNVLDEVWDTYRLMNETDVRCALAAFLFKGEDVFKAIKTLSGGEKARVCLLKLMLRGSNVLFLDEPTNHLDIKSREALEAAFDSCDGTMIIVSHDRYFIDRLATKIVHLKSDGVDIYEGNYDEFMKNRQDTKIVQETKKPKKENEYKKRKEFESELRKTKGKISRLEQDIENLDEQITHKQAEISDPDNSSDYEKILSLTDELNSLLQLQEDKMMQWEELNEVLESMV